MSDARTWSTTDSSNNSAAPNGWATGTMIPSEVEPTGRAMMGGVARWLNDMNAPITTGGSSTAYTISINQQPASIAAPLAFLVKWHTTSGSSPTLNINSKGAKNIYWASGVQATTGDLVQDTYSWVFYDGTNVVILQTKPATLAGLGAAASSLTLTAGAGLTGGGDLSSNRSFAVGAGNGIVANTDDVAVDIASQANMEAKTANKIPDASVLHFHPLMPKAWGYVTYSGGTPTLVVSGTSSGTLSITDTNQGRLTVTFGFTASSSSYGVLATADDGGSGEPMICGIISKTTTQFEIQIRGVSKSLVDPASVAFAMFGDI